MFKWSPFPFLRYSVVFILGILAYEIVPEDLLAYCWLAVGIALGVFLVIRNLGRTGVFPGILGLAVIFLLGLLRAHYFDERNLSDHLSKLETSDISGFSGSVVGDVYEKERYYRFEVKLDSVIQEQQAEPVQGRIFLYLKRPGPRLLSYGDYIFVQGNFSPLPSPKNPKEFDYRSYIARSNIYGQCFVEAPDVHVAAGGTGNLLIQLAYEMRAFAKGVLSTYVVDEREQQIAMALVLGIKSFLDNEVKSAYAAAGAMHVLAVSGLHVGIIYFILLFLLKPLKEWRFGTIPFGVSLIGGIWLYAMITGLSPSVMRAATMFTVISLRDISGKRSNIYNSLGIAAFVLLIFNPFFIYSVGFQLSFIAVFGIVYFYPKFYAWLSFRTWLADKIWSITCISMAAQLATFPLVIYYFHQFPTYFLLSNLVVIPGASLILGLAIPLIVFSFWIPVAGKFLGGLLSMVMYNLNELVFAIEKLPESLIDWLYLETLQVFLIYGVIVLIFSAIQYRSLPSLGVGLSLVALLSFTFAWNRSDITVQRRLVFYEIRDHTAFDIIDGHQARFYIDQFEESEIELLKFQIDPFRLASGLESIEETLTAWDGSDEMQRTGPIVHFLWHDVRTVIVDKPLSSFEFKNRIKTDILVLARNAVRDLNEIGNSIEFEYLLIGSSNHGWLSAMLYDEAQLSGINAHVISKDGFWMLDLSKTAR